MHHLKYLKSLCVLVLTLSFLGVAARAQTSAAPINQVSVHIATMPIADTVGTYVGEKLGYFKEAGLELKVTKFSSGPETISAVIAGKADIAYAGSVPFLNAVTQGVPLVIIAGNSLAHGAPPDPHSIIVAKESSISTTRELQNKKIAINAIGSISQLYPMELLSRNGVDTKSIQWVELPFPAMNDALLRKQVDAIANVEPFTSIILASGKATEIAYPYVDVQPNLHIAMWVATKKWVEQNPETLNRFLKAWDKSVQFMRSEDSRTRALIAEFTGIKGDLAANIRLNQWSSKVDVPSLEKTAELMRKWKLIEKSVDVQTLVYIRR